MAEKTWFKISRPGGSRSRLQWSLRSGAPLGANHDWMSQGLPAEAGRE